MKLPTGHTILQIKQGGKILSFGELLLRICPDTEGQWLQQNKMPFYMGGAEANVAAALALWSLPAMYMSCIPENMMCRQLTAALSQKGVDVSQMIYAGERLGLYFLPQGKDLKNAGVIYDRAYSAFSQLKVGMIDWNQVLEEVSWLHFSAISPALNENLAQVCLEAATVAAQKNIVVSVDLNYRAKLWHWTDPLSVMPAIASHCDVLMGNLWAAETMLGVNQNPVTIKNTETYLQQALHTSQKIRQQFPKVKVVANTFRFDQQAGGVQYYATLFAADHLYTSAAYHIKTITDKVGSGDCFMAGLISGFFNHNTPQQTLDFATAAAVRKLSEAGDATRSTVADIQQTIKAHE
ncbi:MAG TPA: sugar kinase [Chitinophagaceae bacterium]|nr:sugar kinase [Chitinophagaceae bacterium]